MESGKPSLLRRALAVLILAIVAVLALRIAIGFVVGAVTAVFWIVVLVALVVAALWARRTLKSSRRGRAVDRTPRREVEAPAEDPIQREMRKISEQLREQGKRR